ncbi:MAG: ABC transporter substrate-binding protein [Defluviitoga tunisiensis]|nr:ABC transporter substrate-binding protein [Defluviitoga tunisiensis]HOB16917.1 ABC transporter substrate-binding protein [Defluviitoga sp.]HOK16894.1 ABC transporter substrate-binding protein [Defluviitoga tunisiensis]HOL86167.1 ABC transporter substrate-binding protein [Defluviitoga tunisiensis]HPP09829.1 ABC transporter substrate-binding protein [Defluviitoga tunisiensis]
MSKKVLLLSLIVLMVGIFFSQVLPSVPRNETLIVETSYGRIANPSNFNIWIPGSIPSQGVHQCITDGLWYVDPQTGELIKALASEPPIYNDDFTQMTIKLREGIYWSDGIQFTADDVVFTIKNIMSNPGFKDSASYKQYVKNIYKTDDFTVVVELTKPYPRFHDFLTSLSFGTTWMQPKHIWEKIEDPLSYNFYPPVSLTPYVLDSYDTQGYWFLYKKRDDWQRTSVGQLYGEPKPKYIIFVGYPEVDRKVMAQSRHELDIIFDLTPEGWEVLRKRNEYSVVWYKDFPWAWMDDTNARYIGFNNEKYPFNLKDVRWALTLAINMEEIVQNVYNGITRVTPLPTCPTSYYMDVYYKPLESWLESFTLNDGFKPYDTNIAERIKNYAIQQGYIVSGEPEDIWGIGWWKYDPTEAEKLLLKNGFSKDKNGKWHLPNGETWKISILAPSGVEPDSTRLGFSVADQWRKFGIEVNVETGESGIFSTRRTIGDFDVISAWGNMLGALGKPDLWSRLQHYHSQFYTPSGKATTGYNDIRWKAPEEADKLIDEMASLSPDDPELVELTKEFFKIVVDEMPLIPIAINKKFNANDNYYWTNYPSADNPYMAPVSWWGEAKFMYPRLEPTGRK